MVLATLAAACAKRARVRLKADYTEPLNLYLVTALPPANRKSPVFKAATKPLDDLENALREDARPTVAIGQAKTDGLR